MRLSPTSYAVLGLIGLRGPSTPYELKWTAARTIAYFWPFPHSQLYSEPIRLAAAGLLKEVREIGGRNRKVYSLTKEGRLALTEWLATPPDETYEIRDTALLQLQFFEFASREELLTLAHHQGALHRERLKTYGDIPGVPEDLANAVLFLVSEESSFIVGTALFVDGGCTTMMPGNT